PVMCSTSPRHDQGGAVLGAVAVFSDLTPLKALEVERQRAERLAYFEMLASGIAHEIKNPLVAVKTFAQLLPRRRGDDRFVAEFGRVVTHEIAKMERLLDRLRALSRPGGRPRHPIDLRAPIGAATEAMRPVFTEKSVVLSAAMGQAPCTILGDHSELEQLFQNLLMNAHEATAPGGMVRVEVATSADRAIVAVVDTGPGVPPELLERVFEPFFSTKERGSGLGLAICASIAQTHGAPTKATNPQPPTPPPHPHLPPRRRGTGLRLGLNTILTAPPDGARRARLMVPLGEHSVFTAANDAEALKTLRLIEIDVVVRGGAGMSRDIDAFVTRVRAIAPT